MPLRVLYAHIDFHERDTVRNKKIDTLGTHSQAKEMQKKRAEETTEKKKKEETEKHAHCVLIHNLYNVCMRGTKENTGRREREIS